MFCVSNLLFTIGGFSFLCLISFSFSNLSKYESIEFIVHIYTGATVDVEDLCEDMKDLICAYIDYL